jgi:PEP-CTERM motif
MRRLLRCGLLLCLLLCLKLRANPILMLNPADGAVSASPGQTVGWGFTLINDSGYLLVTSADYITSTPIGIFTDFISAFNFIVVGPAPEDPLVTQSFDNVAFTGIGSYQIDPGTPLGALSTGIIRLTYDLYSVSPNDAAFDPGSDLLASGNVLDASASVQAAGSVPEPSTWLLIGCGLGGVALLRHRRKVVPRGLLSCLLVCGAASAMHAQVGAVCSTFASTPILATEGMTETAGDIVLACTGVRRLLWARRSRPSI